MAANWEAKLVHNDRALTLKPEESIKFGRHKETCQINIDGAHISRLHAEATFSPPNVVYLNALGSNPTMVVRAKTGAVEQLIKGERTQLHHGDSIEFPSNNKDKIRLELRSLASILDDSAVTVPLPQSVSLSPASLVVVSRPTESTKKPISRRLIVEEKEDDDDQIEKEEETDDLQAMQTPPRSPDSESSEASVLAVSEESDYILTNAEDNEIIKPATASEAAWEIFKSKRGSDVKAAAPMLSARGIELVLVEVWESFDASEKKAWEDLGHKTTSRKRIRAIDDELSDASHSEDQKHPSHARKNPRQAPTLRAELRQQASLPVQKMEELVREDKAQLLQKNQLIDFMRDQGLPLPPQRATKSDIIKQINDFLYK